MRKGYPIKCLLRSNGDIPNEIRTSTLRTANTLLGLENEFSRSLAVALLGLKNRKYLATKDLLPY